ncbi:MAG TPA: hypothetical protein VGL72_26575 [Bryobacteraceae bacterium]
MITSSVALGRIAVFTTLSLTSAFAAPLSIGTASARGAIQIDGLNVNGNASLFDGSLVETGEATTTLHIDKGIALKLGAGSRGKIFHDRLILEKGDGEFTNLGAFQVEANTVKVSSDDAAARGVIHMKDSRTVEIASLSGGFDVKSQSGLLLAKVLPGRSLAFTFQEGGAAAPTSVTGMLTKTNGLYFLTVQGTGVIYQVTGRNLDHFVGKSVSITGTLDPSATPARPASAVIVLTSSSKVAAIGLGAGAATATGMALGTKLIIAGVIVAAATGTGVGIYEARKSSPAASPQ